MFAGRGEKLGRITRLALAAHPAGPPGHALLWAEATPFGGFLCAPTFQVLPEFGRGHVAATQQFTQVGRFIGESRRAGENAAGKLQFTVRTGHHLTEDMRFGDGADSLAVLEHQAHLVGQERLGGNTSFGEGVAGLAENAHSQVVGLTQASRIDLQSGEMVISKTVMHHLPDGLAAISLRLGFTQS